MPGPLDTIDWQPQDAARPDTPAADTRPAPGLLDTLLAGGEATRADTTGFAQERREAAYAELIRGLADLGYPVDRYVFPSRAGSGMAYERIFADAQREKARGRFTDLPDTIEAFEEQWRTRAREQVEAAEETAARGNPVVAFVGGLGGAMTDPVNLYSLPLGGFGRTLAQKVLSEAAINMGIEALLQPAIAEQREELGRRDLTVGEAAMNIGMAGVGAGTIRGGIEIAPGAVRAVDDAGVRALAPVRERFDRFFRDRDLARAFADQVPANLRTPEQEAALQILTREIEIDEASPYTRTIAGDEAHRANLERAAAELARPAARGFNLGRYMARSRGAESGGDDSAAASGSSAFGRYQFVDETWIEFYRRTYGQTGESDAQILAKRADGRVQDRVMRTFTQANVDALQRAGLPVDDGTAYLAHFLGLGDAMRVLRAAPDAPIGSVVSRASIAANPAVFRQVSSASELVAWARRKMGGNGRGVPASGEADALAGLELGPDDLGDLPVIRPEALDADRPFVSSAGRQVPVAQFSTADIGVDAELMQFKSGGDEFGVTDRLQGVQEWDPVAAGMVTVWEGADGRRLIADGHQRLGLAKRIEAATGQPVLLNAFVLREADGFSARDARIVTALKNIGEGTGTASDAAKVLRDAGEAFEAAIERRLPPRSALVRDGKALARLSDEAFGAVVNEVIPEGHAAAIGHLAPDPDTHMALVEVLAATEPANRRQAEAIVRQALEAGFARETQEELFGSRDVATALFAQRARLLDRALSELRRLKGAFGVAARNAEALESGGNRIDVAGSEAAASANAQALGLVERLALRKGNAVNALFDQAARRLAAGEPLARVTRDLVAGIRRLDLADLERADDGAFGLGDGAGGSGRAGEPAGQAAEDQGELSPSEIDELQAEQDLGPSLFEAEPVARAFDDDAGEGVKAAAESDWHDIRRNGLANDLPGKDIGAALEQRIAGDFEGARAEYEALEDPDTGMTSEGGRVLNTDLARELSPEYRADRSRSAEVHEPASAFVKRLYAEKLAEGPPAGRDRTVLFTAGGTGAGKSTGLRLLEGENAGIIYDTNMNTLASAIDKIEQALEAGWQVEILYTYRDPIEALVNGALPRAERMGRTVPLEAHVETHVGARQTMAALAERYADNPEVRIRAVDNSLGRNKARLAELEKLPEVDQVGLHERAEQEVRAAFERGAIGRETLRGTLGERAGDLSPAARPGGGRLGAEVRGQPEPADRAELSPLDRGEAADPNIAERQREAAALGAAAPLRARAEQDGTMGLGLFDRSDQPTFDLDDGKGPRTAAEIEAEIAAEKAGLEEIRKCLK